MINPLELETAIVTIRKTKPLVLNLTNYVTMDFMANSLLALGAAPLMSVCDAELEELIKISHAVNINIGTLDENFITRAVQAVKLAKTYHKPVIVDPVGCGASSIRTKTARKLMLIGPSIIRGNASEIMALFDTETKSLGVESLHATDQAKNHAHQLAKNHQLTIVVSGEKDFITDATTEIILPFGSPLMKLITGMGCALTAIIAAFRAVIPNDFEAATLATAYFGLCGNLAAIKSGPKPGLFRSMFIDELYSADFNAMLEILNAKSKQYAI
jgi:hydroxyethylthiazole kinase